jgi:hypothetical protein
MEPGKWEMLCLPAQSAPPSPPGKQAQDWVDCIRGVGELPSVPRSSPQLPLVERVLDL